MKHLTAACVVTAALLLASCNNGNVSGSCGQPPPSAVPQFFLVSPQPGSSGVPTTLGTLIFSGTLNGTVQMSGPAGSVPIGALVAATPIPTPTPSPGSGSQSINTFFTASVPTLASGATYTVTETLTQWASTLPSCQQTVQQTLGTFTTQ